MISNDEVRALVDEFVAAGRVRVEAEDGPKNDFEAAVRKLVADELDPHAARQLINNAVSWGVPLDKLSAHADTLLAARAKHRELQERFPGQRRSM